MRTDRAEQTATAPVDAELMEQIRDLVRQYRSRCLWFAEKDYFPADRTQALNALRHIERHGDREAFLRARRLRAWLLQNSSEPSAG